MRWKRNVLHKNCMGKKPHSLGEESSPYHGIVIISWFPSSRALVRTPCQSLHWHCWSLIRITEVRFRFLRRYNNDDLSFFPQDWVPVIGATQSDYLHLCRVLLEPQILCRVTVMSPVRLSGKGWSRTLQNVQVCTHTLVPLNLSNMEVEINTFSGLSSSSWVIALQ